MNNDQLQSSRKLSDAELDAVTGGRKAGEGQKDFGGASSPPTPPTPIETLVRWIISIVT
jgi:hypothetical protein